MNKRCGKCKQTKSQENFHKSKTSADGLAGYCKLCAKEYAKNRNAKLGPKSVEITEFPKSKVCSECKHDKAIENFYNSSISPDGHAWKCIECSKELSKKSRSTPEAKELASRRGKERAAKLRQERTPEERRDFYLKSRHGIGIDKYKEIYESQNGLCAICNKYQNFPTLFIDHDHNKGCHPMKATSCDECRRGLLCSECNIGIAYLKDDPAVLVAAYKYLIKK